MSYLVMARRWRPQTFADVVGQQHVTRTLQRAIERGRVAHAYIFTGPRGVGKTSTARLLAKAVNCPNMQVNAEGLPEPCNECPTCQDISSGNAMDVIEIDGASNNKVEDVRQLRETIKYAPSSLNKKVYIIDEVHMLSGSAFNALLKTLEEPPDHAMFIFATTEIHKVPATVLSRCQRYDFKRIATNEIKGHLERIVKGDNLKVDDAALVSIAVKAEGALRDALSVMDQLVAYQGDEPITGDVVRQALGLIGSEIYFRTTDVAATGNVGAAIEIARAIANGGHDPREYLRGLQHHVMRFLYLKAGGNGADLPVSEEDRAAYEEKVDRLDDEDYLRMGEWASEAEDLLRDALDPQVRLELLLVRISRMDRAVDLGALLQRMGVEPKSFRQPMSHGEAKRNDPPKQQSSQPVAQPAPQPTQQLVASGREHTAPQSVPSSENEEERPEGEQLGSEPVKQGSESDNESKAVVRSQQQGELTVERICSDWVKISDAANTKKLLLGSQLGMGAPTGFVDDALELTFEQQNKFAMQEILKHRDIIAEVLRECYGVSLRLIISTGEIPKEARPERRRTEEEIRREKIKDALETNAVWKDMVQRFELKMNGER